MSPTERYVEILRHLKSGELGLLRTHAGRGLDETVDGFDLFAGLWWPLRAQDQRTPRRGVAWMIAKLYALRPVDHSPGSALAFQVGRCRPQGDPDRERFAKGFDRMLSMTLGQIEPALRGGEPNMANSELRTPPTPNFELQVVPTRVGVKRRRSASESCQRSRPHAYSGRSGSRTPRVSLTFQCPTAPSGVC